ncbi:hypothetical protein EVAR_62847_1 [Eumeta japonica]|uniref:Uncharacterized protein n=1 Tax=Eumeta variegata TaxID=151549 RepID=A0A4C1ZH26_EUMVA|nr:hypothetical protein EVAR_62847_1 [Eumeta japonica]
MKSSVECLEEHIGLSILGAVTALVTSSVDPDPRRTSPKDASESNEDPRGTSRRACRGNRSLISTTLGAHLGRGEGRQVTGPDRSHGMVRDCAHLTRIY